jgi:hypothetical protein
MTGGDSEIGALWATVTEPALFRIQFPGSVGLAASLGPEAQCFRVGLGRSGPDAPEPALGNYVCCASQDKARGGPGGGTDRSLR